MPRVELRPRLEAGSAPAVGKRPAVPAESSLDARVAACEHAAVQAVYRKAPLTPLIFPMQHLPTQRTAPGRRPTLRPVCCASWGRRVRTGGNPALRAPWIPSTASRSQRV